MYKAIARNKRNTVFIIALFLLIIGCIAAIIGGAYNSWPLTVGIIAGAIVYAVIQYFAASSEAMTLAGGIEIKQEHDNVRLWRIVENLVIAEGMPMPRLYIINDPSPNAFATGRDPKTARVAATTGLLDLLDDSELEGVMAHELSHVKNHDIRVSMIVFGLVVAVGIIADLFLRMTIYGSSGRRGGNRNGNIILLVIALVAMIVAPLISAMIQAAVSRQREYLADASGALMTRHPEGLAKALHKISGGHSEFPMPALRKVNSSMAHMWFSNPMQGRMARLFSTHPPTDKRIQRLMNIGETF